MANGEGHDGKFCIRWGGPHGHIFPMVLGEGHMFIFALNEGQPSTFVVLSGAKYIAVFGKGVGVQVFEKL